MSDTPNFGFPLVPSNSLQPSVPINEALQDIDALLRPGSIVQAMDIAADPTTTSGDVGKMWIVAASGSGDWTGKDDQIALCTAANVWKFYVPEEGWEVRNLDEANRLYVYAGSSGWVSGIPASDVSADNGTSGLTGTTVQDQLDELAAAVGITGNAMTLIDSVAVTGSAATTLAASGLDLSAYKAFFVLVKADNATGSSAAVSMYYNADTTATNYYTQSHSRDNSTSGGSRSNAAVILALDANENTNAAIHVFKDFDGKARAMSSSIRGAASAVQLNNHYTAWTSNANVTGITLSSSVSNSLAIGTVMYIFGIN